MKFDENGRCIEIRRVPDLPSDYDCPEWKAYDAAVDAVIAAGLDGSEEMTRTYAAYHHAMERKAAEQEGH